MGDDDKTRCYLLGRRRHAIYMAFLHAVGSASRYNEHGDEDTDWPIESNMVGNSNRTYERRRFGRLIGSIVCRGKAQRSALHEVSLLGGVRGILCFML